MVLDHHQHPREVGEMTWEAFCRTYPAPKEFADALLLYDLWVERNRGVRR